MALDEHACEAAGTVEPAADRWPTRVLLVDDAAATRRFVRAVLEASNAFDVVAEAADGEQAVELAAIAQPDLVLLDLLMPGDDAARIVEGLTRAAPGSMIVVLSGADQALAAPLLDQGVAAFVSKGATADELVGRLLALCTGRAAVDRPSAFVDAPRPSRARAVVCEDDPSTRRLLTQLLESCDVEVAAETDMVPNLLSVVELAQPEVVILDLWLEGTPGTAALPEIHRRSPSSTTIVYSSYEEWRDRALAGGAAAFVAKPDLEELGRRVRAVVGR